MPTQTTCTHILDAHTGYVPTQTLHIDMRWEVCAGDSADRVSACLLAITADTGLMLAEFATLPSHLSHYTFRPALRTPTALSVSYTHLTLPTKVNV